MIQDTSTVWVWDDDRDLLDRTNVAIQVDYQRSTLSKVVFWDADTPVVTNDRLIYSTTGAAAKKLSSYAYYPPDPHLPVINTALRNEIESVCGANQVAFHPCEIRTKSGLVIDAWNLYPLNRVACINREESTVVWDKSESDPEEWTVKSARGVKFNPSCLGSLDIARMKEDFSWILVSDRLKKVIENFNAKGIRFRLDRDSRIGNPFGLE